ncbi:AzlC family ABC transporter permease [Desmospora activa]|uniref:4-azaleucine resistance transporter AzlC n=1 Tax=Desmospora activa DSM 45169 TaxID=1121389 RepID=A0A2T4Z4H1_9BACL|nr:AzlC family ABC transporter permease [Desmospora activa]PTM56794.1 4-azaleucine resistance transporter AzlC [Desmospora activa DSM 45169]
MEDKKKTIKAGLIETLPIAIAVAAYGISYGVLATQAQFSLAETIAMSLFVFSGSVQMVTVAMLMGGATLTSILVTSALLNLRNLLYGAALAEGLHSSRKQRWLLSFGVTDESFVLGSQRFKKYGPDPLYFAAVAGTLYFAWAFSTLIGALIGNQVDPLKWGLDLAFPVTFVALLIPSLKDKPVIATALSAVVIAIGLESLAPGNEFTIILTGVLSPLVGLYLKRRGNDVS